MLPLRNTAGKLARISKVRVLQITSDQCAKRILTSIPHRMTYAKEFFNTIYAKRGCLSFSIGTEFQRELHGVDLLWLFNMRMIEIQKPSKSVFSIFHKSVLFGEKKTHLWDP